MARVSRPGIDYFPLDTEFDNNLRMYIIEHEAIGLAVWVLLLQHIYRDKGYYVEYSNDLLLLIKHEINVDINRINACINSLIERNILNKELFEKHKILTSRGIQKRYFEAAKRKKFVEIVPEYLLISIENYTNAINVNINSINVNINPINAQKTCNNSLNKKENKNKKKIKRKIKEKENSENSQNEFSPPIDPHNVLLIFNEENRFLPPVRYFTAGRRTAVMDLMQQHCRSPSQVESFLKNFRRAVQLCQEVPFLHGENPRKWKATFDWLINGDNYIRVLEGSYGEPEEDEETRWQRFIETIDDEKKEIANDFTGV